ncbi:MAG TPA: DUF4355 domain-containing protein [Propionibacterium sp.]|nr:DUF4355 domain-containing protein [Propionibacterium sp.]
MSETTSTAGISTTTAAGGNSATTATGQDNSTPPEFQAPQSQADLDRIIENRLARERAKYAGFDDFNAKAERFDQLQAANQTDLEKATTRAEKAEAELAKAQAAALRAEVAAAKGLPAELAARLTGATREELEADADALAKLIPPKAPAAQQPASFSIPSHASSGGDAANDAAARAFFGL